MIAELDLVALTRDVPDAGLKAGDVGTVVLEHGQGAAFEVEFVALEGSTVAQLTLPASSLRPVSANEIAHARTIN